MTNEIIKQAINTIKEELEKAKQNGDLNEYHTKVLVMKCDYFEDDLNYWWGVN